MKKIFLALTATTTLTLASFNFVSAQQASAANDKNELAYAAPSEAKAATASAAVNVHALKDFQKSFNAANASWYKTEKGNFIASFTDQDVKNSITYNKNGNWLYSIKSYDESKLPKDVRAQVKSTYYDYNIIHVDEVQIAESEPTIYMVLIQNATSIIRLRLCDGEMQEVENLVRSN